VAARDRNRAAQALQSDPDRADARYVTQTRALLLLVEDDDLLASVMTEILAPVADVRWAASAEAAMQIASDEHWDLVIADIELPGMSGIDFIVHSKVAQPVVSTLVVSGRTAFQDAVSAIRAGADDYLTKPIDPQTLLDKARELIGRTRVRRAQDLEVVLAIGAHPDDVEIGCGGILARHVATGDQVAVLTLSGGEQGGEAVTRAKESQRAAEILGARLFHADLIDTSVSEGGDTIATIKQVIDEVQPTIVYTHTARDVHQDHRNVHHATLVAARGIPRIYCYQAPSTTIEFRPTRFVTIDGFLERKLESIDAYGSQVAVRDYLDPELLRATARYWGRFSRSRFVEPLEVVRESDPGSDTPALAVASTLADMAAAL
jgi:LmbE family N-acetylglucosaminyl deacetylase/CheY-like chemotaxis protein